MNSLDQCVPVRKQRSSMMPISSKQREHPLHPQTTHYPQKRQYTPFHLKQHHHHPQNRSPNHHTSLPPPSPPRSIRPPRRSNNRPARRSRRRPAALLQHVELARRVRRHPQPARGIKRQTGRPEARAGALCVVRVGHDLVKDVVAVVGGDGLPRGGVEGDDGDGVAYGVGLVDCGCVSIGQGGMIGRGKRAYSCRGS